MSALAEGGASQARSRLRGAPIASLIAGILITLTIASGAQAGTYVINNCPSAPQPNGDAGPWVVFGGPQASKASCGGGEGDYIGPQGASMSPGSLDGVQVTAPAGSGITIRKANVWWYVPQQTSGATTFALAGTNGGLVGESGTPLERRGKPDVFALASSTTSFTLDDYCSNDDAGQGCGFGGGENPNLQLFGSQLTLEDSRLPTGSVTGGGLASGTALSGTQSIAYDAQDADSGVRLVQLLIDGQPVAQNDYVARCPYSNFAACPPDESDTLGWNTAAVADGQHSLEVIVESAAQNTRTIYLGTVTTQNAPSEASLGALPAPSTGGAEAARIAPGGPGAPNGAAASEAAELRLGVKRTIGRSFAARALRLPGRLLNAQAQPIGGATVDVLEQLTGSSQTGVITHARTAADGSFLASVPAGPSRVIEVAYRAFGSDASYAAQARVEESVGAGVRLNVIPRRTGSAGTIVLTGRVHGPIPAHGTIIELLVRYRGRWEPFRAPRTDSSGHFQVSYQFQGAVGRFPFRAEVPAGQAGFPFAAGYSAVVVVQTS
jgi:hypothetical protein